jgi:putative ABC transport system substrate-binding protein
MMRRREFITLLGGVAAAWPVAARAQRPGLPTIGALHAASRAGTTNLMAAYFEGLKSESYVEGQNVAIEYRWADGVLERLPAMLTDLVRLQPDVIVAFGTAARIAAAARRAGTAGTAPILLSIGADPLSGYVTSLNRPNDNMTGATSLASTLAAKRVEVLHELTPGTAKLALLENPGAPGGRRRRSDVTSRARRAPLGGNCMWSTPSPRPSLIRCSQRSRANGSGH